MRQHRQKFFVEAGVAIAAGINLTMTSITRTVVGLALLAAGLLAGCTGKAAAPAPQPPEVAVVTVQRAAVPVTTELPGRTSAFLVAQVRARVDGIVLKREFREGGDIKAGPRSTTGGPTCAACSRRTR